MVYKQYPKVTASGLQNVEKMDLIYNNLMEKAYGTWSKFVTQAIIEKWERDILTQRKTEHEVYSSIFDLIQRLTDYNITRRHGLHVQAAYKANVITAEEIDMMYNNLENIKRDCLDSGAGRALLRKKNGHQSNFSSSSSSLGV